MSKKFSITIIEAPDQNQRENPNNQFSNSEPMTFAQKVEYVKSMEMTNNKQQTEVDSIIEFCQKQMDNDSSIHKGVYLSIIKFCKEQAKEMEAIGKEISYSDGYAQGYQRALDYISMSIENAKALISTEII